MTSTSEPPAARSKPRRRWLRFSLRTLLVVVVNRARKQRDVVAWVQEVGGTVTYDYEIGDDGYRLEDAKPPGPEWLIRYLGIDFFHDVRGVNLNNTQVSDVTPLAGLTSLEGLSLSDTQVSDVTPLAALTSLEHLQLWGTQVKDVTPLAGLTSLEYLDLTGTQVSEAAVEQLQKALPKCLIRSQ